MKHHGKWRASTRWRRSSAILTVLTALCTAHCAMAGEKLRVVASIPDLGDFARRIGGDKVSVTVLATGKEDLHAVPARPSFLPILNKADLLLVLGLDAEHSWLTALVEEARNPRIREDGPGWIDCSRGIAVLGKPQKLDRSEGEQHPEGNPHYNIGPQNGAVMVDNIAGAFAKADPANAESYRSSADKVKRRIEALGEELTRRGASLNGVAIVDYHPDVIYICAFYAMKSIGSLEPKAGVPPTAGHLKRLAETARGAGVKMVVYNQSQNAKVARKLAAQVGCPAIQIANAVGAREGITTWEELQRHNLEQLLGGFDGGVK